MMAMAYLNGVEVPSHIETMTKLLPFPTTAWAAAWFTLQLLMGEPLQQPYYLYGLVVLDKPATAGDTVEILYDACLEPNPVRWARL